MRWRTSHGWALACCIALVAVLAGVWHPVALKDSAAGMSAPPAPRVSVESAPFAKLLPSHFDWSGQILRPANLAPALIAPHRREGATHVAAPIAQDYVPLHRRPPPRFS